MRARAVAGLVVLAVFLALLCAAGLVMMLYTRVRRQWAWGELPAVCPPDKPYIRVRTLNVFMGIKSGAAAQSGVLKGADVVVFQEMFRRPWREPLADLAKVTGAWVVSVPFARQIKNRPVITDSGLAAASLTCPVQCVAFMPFKTAISVDRLAEKGAAVFDVGSGRLRLCVVHMQASYGKPTKKDVRVRRLQFAAALRVAVQHGAHVLVGDVNTASTRELQGFDHAVRAVCGGHRLPDDGKMSSPQHGVPVKAWRKNPDALGQRVDHAWTMCPCVQTTPLRTLRDLSAGLSDHAVLEFDVLVPPKCSCFGCSTG